MPLGTSEVCVGSAFLGGTGETVGAKRGLEFGPIMMLIGSEKQHTGCG